MSGVEHSLLRVLNRQRRLTVSKAVDLTGFEAERCRVALESLKDKRYATIEGSEYWITEEGSSYISLSKSLTRR